MKEHVNTCVYEYVRVGCASGQIYILQWAD